MNTNNFIATSIDEFIKTNYERNPKINTAKEHDVLDQYIDPIKLLNSLINSNQNESNYHLILNSLVRTIRNLIPVKAYYFQLRNHNKLEFEDLDAKEFYYIKSFIEEAGILDLILNDKKILVLPDPKHFTNEEQIYWLIFPVFLNKDLFAIFCIQTNIEQKHLDGNKIEIMEILINFTLQKFATCLSIALLNKVNDDRLRLNKFIDEISKLGAVGELWLSSVHNLKNKIQILVSSFELLNKGVKSDELMKIINSEIPNLSILLKKISDFSKFIVSEPERGYYDVEYLISTVVDTIKSTDSNKDFKFIFIRKSPFPKFYGFGNLLQEALIHLLNSAKKIFSQGIHVYCTVEETSNKIIISLKFDTQLYDKKKVEYFVNKSENINFALANQSVKKNKGTILTRLGADNLLEILISIPKRSKYFHSNKNS